MGVLGLIILYLIKGKVILHYRLFNYLFFFCLLDAIFMYIFPEFMYIFPEIPAAVANAIFL